MQSKTRRPRGATLDTQKQRRAPGPTLRKHRNRGVGSRLRSVTACLQRLKRQPSCRARPGGYVQHHRYGRSNVGDQLRRYVRSGITKGNVGDQLRRYESTATRECICFRRSLPACACPHADRPATLTHGSSSPRNVGDKLQRYHLSLPLAIFAALHE